jgi:hypothetical protein
MGDVSPAMGYVAFFCAFFIYLGIGPRLWAHLDFRCPFDFYGSRECLA